MPKPIEATFNPNLTQWDFIKSDRLENLIVASRGEGKTDSAIMAMTFWASMIEKKYRPLPWAIIRDTWKNLERTTLRSFLTPREGAFASQIRSRLKIRDGGRYIELPGIWYAFLFGVDSPDDLNQLQSMQLYGLWVEEAAPALQEEIGNGISEEVWQIGLTSLRHPIMSEEATAFVREMSVKGGKEHLTPAEIKEGSKLGALVTKDFGDGIEVFLRNRRAQITENYPSEDHWTWVRFHEEPTQDCALFQIPRGENPYIDISYREGMEKALRGRPDLLDRLVYGRPAHVQLGIAVTPEYHESMNSGPWHRSDKDLDPMPNLPVYRFWDGDLHPSCHFAQITPRGNGMGLDA